MKTIHKVVDISEHNSPDWDFVKNTFDAVNIRIGVRGSMKENPQYYGKIRYDFKAKEFIRKCQSLGIPFTFYFFPTAITEAEAHEEGEWLVNAIKEYDVCLPVCQDSETVVKGEKGRADKLSKADRTHFINIVNQHLKDAGIPYGVYASESWFRDKLTDHDLIEGTQRWVAQYASKCDYTGEYFMWQYGKMGGLDANDCYIEFIGKKEADDAPKATQMISAREKVADIMLGWIGRKESNGTHKAIIDIYNNYLATAVKLHGTLNWKMPYGEPWCATAVSAAFIAAGFGNIFPVECSCPRMIKIAKEMGIWQESDSYVPKVSDAILYDWQDNGIGENSTGVPDHVGLVTAVSGDDIIVTEGNFNDSVCNRRMNINGRYIRGYVTPKFPDTVEAAHKEDTAKAETKLTYASGKPSKVTKFTGAVTASALNVRMWAGTEYGKCSFSPLPRGTRVEVCDAVKAKDGSDWFYIRYNGKYGFVSAQYITR